jgi:hypothetical protein
MSLPKLTIPRPPQNTPPKPGARDSEKPLGFKPPAAAPAGERSTGGIGRVASHLYAPRAKAPAAPVVIRYDEYGRPTLSPDEIPF